MCRVAALLRNDFSLLFVHLLGEAERTETVLLKKPPVFQRFRKVKLKRDKVIWGKWSGSEFAVVRRLYGR